jgi:hypothetical protein
MSSIEMTDDLAPAYGCLLLGPLLGAVLWAMAAWGVVG